MFRADARPSDAARLRPTRHGGLVALALGLATLLHLRQVAYLASADNRYLVHWQRADAAALAALLLLTAAAVAGAYGLLGRGARGGPGLRVALLTWLAATGALSLLGWRLEPGPGLDWAGGAVALALAAAAGRAGRRVEPVLPRAGWLLLPVCVVTALQVAAWPPWGSPLDALEPPPRAAGGEPGPPVYVFVFDAWSYDQTFAAGRVRPFLPALRDLAARSGVFHRAWAPSRGTAASLPRLLFGLQAGAIAVEDGHAVWAHGAERRPVQALPSLFTPFARRGYRTALSGFYLPYRKLLGPDAQVVRSEPHEPRGWRFADRVVSRALAGARFLPVPGLGGPLRQAWRSRYSESWLALNGRVERDVLEVLERWPRRTLLFAHWPTPHPPFVLDADGSYRGPFRGERRAGSEEDYRRHLRNLDRIVGAIVATLTRRGTFDDALLVLTSDHGWKGRDADSLHVPLLVKRPGQTRAVAVRDPFPTRELGPLLARTALGP